MDSKRYLHLDCLHLMHFLVFLCHDMFFICLEKSSQEFQEAMNPGVVVGRETVIQS